MMLVIASLGRGKVVAFSFLMVLKVGNLLLGVIGHKLALTNQNLNFFSGLIPTTSSVVFIVARIAYISFLHVTSVHIYDFHIIPTIIHHSEGLFESNIMTSSQLAC